MKRMGTRLMVLALLLLGLVFAPLGDAFAQGQTSARGGIFKDVELKPDGRAEVPVEIRGVNELYAADIEIRFDPNVIQIEDANPDVDGVQPALGTFLDAGLVLYNRVDNQEGLVQFVMTQANPSEPKSGDGILLVLYVVGVAQGESDLGVTNLELSDRGGVEIPVEVVDAKISVSDAAVASHAAPVPVQDQAGLVQIPTMAPAEEAPTRMAPTTPVETKLEEALAAEPDTEEAEQDALQVTGADADTLKEEKAPTKTLLDYWWIVLIIAIAAIGAAVYLMRNKNNET